MEFVGDDGLSYKSRFSSIIVPGLLVEMVTLR